MSFVLRGFYVQRSFSLTGKNHIASILPILSGVIFLVIIIVKSSLALSLGLVGALSIVRFRTPIKEPEELVYLFLAIAIGLGYGAGQTLITTLLVVMLLGIIFVWLSNRAMSAVSEYNLVLNWKNSDVSSTQLVEKISDLVGSLKLVRYDIQEADNRLVLLVETRDGISPDELFQALKSAEPTIVCSFFEAKSNW